VQATLDTEEAKVGKFTLAPQNEVLPTWQRRGQKGQLSDHNDAASLVRCVPGEDRTNGFFVACFVKTRESLARIGELKGSRAVTDEQHSNRPRKKQRLDSF